MVRLASYRKKEALKGRVVFTSPTKRPHPHRTPVDVCIELLDEPSFLMVPAVLRSSLM